jgi:DNA modification methylase
MLIRELLSSKGTLYLHLDRNVSQAVKMICDEVFGDESFINDLTWKRSHAHGDTGQGAKHFGRVSESILVYAKDNTGNQTWSPQYIPYTEQILARDYKYVDEQGNRYRLMPCDGPGGASKGNPHYEFKGIKGYWRYSKQTMQELYDAGEIVVSSTGKSLSRKRFLKDAKGTPIVDLWDDLNRISPTSSERLNYPTQKPEALLERIIRASSNEGDLIADFFCGSGTTLAVAEKLGRRWIGSDLGRFAIHTTRKRLLGVPECKPFQILNLGQYERKYWQGVMFGKPDASPEAALVAEYVRFILELYQAQPCPGFRYIHGRKGRVLVAVGAVDAPVTITQVNEAVTECAAAGQKELHILGWEWEMGMNDPIIKQAKASHDVTLRLMTIPREVMEKRAVECGDIRFFDVAYLKAEVEPQDKAKRKVKIELKNFAIPDTELIPEDVRQKISKWSDYIDYWAIDWDYRRDTFMNQWQTYRTRTDRKLALVSSEHEYTTAGKYEILVKVVDIFGNDTSLLLEWKAK